MKTNKKRIVMYEWLNQKLELTARFEKASHSPDLNLLDLRLLEAIKESLFSGNLSAEEKIKGKCNVSDNVEQVRPKMLRKVGANFAICFKALLNRHGSHIKNVNYKKMP